ncbi:hypothetical protein HDU98_003322 [Podochytrium sp. JEL0797]|nr:hypothetical protein HDU98_003322 [Podochytrium sp. JEL0797]
MHHRLGLGGYRLLPGILGVKKEGGGAGSVFKKRWEWFTGLFQGGGGSGRWKGKDGGVGREGAVGGVFGIEEKGGGGVMGSVDSGCVVTLREIGGSEDGGDGEGGWGEEGGKVEGVGMNGVGDQDREDVTDSSMSTPLQIPWGTPPSGESREVVVPAALQPDTTSSVFSFACGPDELQVAAQPSPRYYHGGGSVSPLEMVVSPARNRGYSTSSGLGGSPLAFSHDDFLMRNRGYSGGSGGSPLAFSQDDMLMTRNREYSMGSSPVAFSQDDMLMTRARGFSNTSVSQDEMLIYQQQRQQSMRSSRCFSLEDGVYLRNMLSPPASIPPLRMPTPPSETGAFLSTSPFYIEMPATQPQQVYQQFYQQQQLLSADDSLDSRNSPIPYSFFNTADSLLTSATPPPRPTLQDLRNYFKRVEQPKAAKAGSAVASTATTPASGSASGSGSKCKGDGFGHDEVKASPYFGGSSSKASLTKKAAVDPSSFFNSKIHQSEKTVKPPSAAETKKPAASKKTPSKKPSIAKPDDDDEFADFDIDLSNIDEKALEILDGKGADEPEPAAAVKPVSKQSSPAKPTSNAPKGRSKALATMFESDDDDDFVAATPQKKAPTPIVADATKKATSPTRPVVAVKSSPMKPVESPAKVSKKTSPVKPVVRVETPAAASKNPSPAKRAMPSVDVPDVAAEEPPKKKAYGSWASKAGPSAPGSKQIPVGEPNCLAGSTFVFTGELTSITRDDAQDLVKRYAGRVTGSISGKTTYVVVGEEAGVKKLEKATALKIKQINEDELLDLIRTSKAKAEPVVAPAKGKKTPAKVVVPVHAKKDAFQGASAGSFYPVKAATGVAASASSAGVAAGSSSAAKGKAPVYASTPAPPPKKPSSGELWTTKYKPTQYSDVMGNKKSVEQLAYWLKTWNATTAADKPAAAKEGPGKSRAILISGPPGIGKTTAAHLVATLEGFEVVEFNASDTRSKKTVGDVVKEMTGSHTLSEYFIRKSDHGRAKRQVLIMDEVDGMSAGDRGGIGELINIIKKSKIPIICICNDRQSPKVKSLVNHCYDMRFARPKTTEIERAIKNIASKEGLDLKMNVVDTLVKSTHSDIRQILNMLSTYSLSNSELNFDQSRELSSASAKNMTLSPWDVASTLLNRGSFRDASFADKLELYFSDFSLIPLMIQENYIKMDSSVAKENGGTSKQSQDLEALNCLSQAADAIAYGDVISSVQMKTQNWGLLPFQGVTSTLRPAFFMHGTLVSTGYFGGGGGFAFPGWLGKNSSQGKSMRLLKEVQLHMRLHVSADKNEVRQSYLPALAPLVTLPLVKQEQSAGIAQVIQTMDEYYLTREDWDSILELGLEECSGKVLTAEIATATKSAFTRTYNKANHPKPFMTTSLLKASRGGGAGGSSSEGVDLEEAMENDDAVVAAGDEEDADEDEDSVGADRLIKQKVAKGAAAKKAPAVAKGKRAAGGEGSGSRGKKQKK